MESRLIRGDAQTAGTAAFVVLTVLAAANLSLCNGMGLSQTFKKNTMDKMMMHNAKKNRALFHAFERSATADFRHPRSG